MNTPEEVAPGVFVVEDLVPAALMEEIVRTARAVDPFKVTRGATLYEEVLLHRISEPLSARFDAWLLGTCRPLMEGCLGVQLRVYGPSSPLWERLGLRTSLLGPPSRFEKALRLRGIRHRLGLQKLEVSPQTFVTKYSEETQPGTGIHRDAMAGASLVLNLSEDYDGGGTYFEELGLTVTTPRGGGVIFSGRDRPHRGVPVARGERFITTTWFHV